MEIKKGATMMRCCSTESNNNLGSAETISMEEGMVTANTESNDNPGSAETLAMEEGMPTANGIPPCRREDSDPGVKG